MQSPFLKLCVFSIFSIEVDVIKLAMIKLVEIYSVINTWVCWWLATLLSSEFSAPVTC